VALRALVSGLTSKNDDARQRNGRLREGLRTAVVAITALLAAVCGGASTASASPAPESGHLYWTNRWIGRANLNGTGVNQRFITGAHFPETGLTVDSRYLYWANNGSGTIGRANLNGTGVKQSFIIARPNESPLGLYGLAVDPGQ
jgi:hypothetical protein